MVRRSFVSPVARMKWGTRCPDHRRTGLARLHGIQNFVSLRGSGYFFLPSRLVIRYLALHQG